MGKLSDLVKYRNELAGTVDSLNLHKEINKKISLVKQVQGNNTVAYNIDQIINNYNQLTVDNDNNIDQLNELVTSINTDIDTLATTLFANRTLLTTVARINLPFEDDLRLLVKTKIKQYCNWNYPGLQISCNDKEWIDCMVAADPLYLTDSAEDRNVDINLTKIISEYSQVYQSRLRLYSVTGHDFSVLPVGQFSIIVCWNFLNYIELDSIAEYIRQMFRLLRAGGTFMFSYNNCDIVESAGLAEGNNMSWATARAILQLCDDIGYEVIEVNNYKTNDAVISYVSWAEIRKPGTLTSVKAHQVLGSIIEK